MTNTRNFNEQNFEQEVLNNKGPVLVDFWAPWCPPCKAIAPTIDAVADEFGDNATVGKVDVDQNSELASRYGIASIPTLLFFKDGEVVDRIKGVASQGDIEQKLAALADAALN